MFLNNRDDAENASYVALVLASDLNQFNFQQLWLSTDI